MMNSRLAGSTLVHQLVPRLFSTSAVARATAAAGPANALLAGSLGISPSRVPAEWLRVLQMRLASTAPAVGGDEDTAAKDAASLPASERKQIESNWGIPPSKLAKEDGTEWRWSCFKPWDTYKPDISIDLKKHHVPTTLPAFRTKKALPIPTHIFFQTFPRCFCVKAQGGTGKDQADNVHSQLSHSVEKDNMGLMPDCRSDGEEGKRQAVISFSPLEARISGLRNESLKIKRTELSQKLTYALIPALLFISKTKLTTSLLILSVYWQIYGFFKEIFLDYVHQEVTRKWALIYFKLLLIILAKDTLLDFDLV